MSRRFPLAFLGLFLLGLGFSACSSTPAPPVPAATPTAPPPVASLAAPVSVKVGTVAFISYAPFWIAEEEGYFKQQNLNAELVDIPS